MKMVDSAAKSRRAEPLHQIFTTVTSRYDLINHVITLGLDRRWRRQAARECLDLQPKRILDLCCGTGDLAINLAQLSGNDTEITGVDYSQPMLEIAIKKSESAGEKRKIRFIRGNAASLPFPEGCFDCVGISFAFRNLTYCNPLAERHLAEVLRVLKNDGRYVILETSQPPSKPVWALYHLYLRHLVFRLSYLALRQSQGLSLSG